jgi:hypothetical protein
MLKFSILWCGGCAKNLVVLCRCFLWVCVFCECVCFFCVGCCAPARKSGGRHVSYSFPLLVSPGVLVCLVGCSSRRLCLGLVVFGAPGLFVVRVESGAVF